MKKQILKIGKVLTKAEQKKVFGGNVNPEDDQEVNYNCYVTCKGSGSTWNVKNCETDADNHCSLGGGWQWCSCWG